MFSSRDRMFLFLDLLFFSYIHGANPICIRNQYLVRGHHRRAYTRSDGTFVSAAKVKPYCKEKTKAYDYVETHLKQGLPLGWPHLSEKPKAWTQFEKERLIEIIEEIPEILLNKDIDFFRAQKSKDFPNPASNTKGSIVLYDTAFNKGRSLGRIISHELAHQNFYDLSEVVRRDFRRVHGWRLELDSKGKIYWGGRQEGYIEDDGKTSDEEDYANNVEHYLYNPDKLKEVTPQGFQWIQKQFGKNFKLKREKK